MHRINRLTLAIASMAVLAVAFSSASAVGAPKKDKNPPPPHCKKGKKKCQKSLPGRMTGAGTVDSSYGRSHHGVSQLGLRFGPVPGPQGPVGRRQSV